jgi:hypothetical protein
MILTLIVKDCLINKLIVKLEKQITNKLCEFYIFENI